LLLLTFEDGIPRTFAFLKLGHNLLKNLAIEEFRISTGFRIPCSELCGTRMSAVVMSEDILAC
jgi:hypothetical protein